MNTKTYTLDSANITTGQDVYNTGRTNLVVTLSSIEQSSYHYTKFIVDFDDGTDRQIIQNTTDIKKLSSESISHIFNPRSDYITTYNIGFSGFKVTGGMDVYPVNLKLSKTAITDYKTIKIIDAQLFTTPAGEHNTLLTIEAQNPRFVGNVIIPYDINTALYTIDTGVPVDLDLTGFYLRTEIYSAAGGEIPIVDEQTSWYFIREKDLIIYVIGNQLSGGWSGKTLHEDESIAICGEADSSWTTTDINGETITPHLLLVPEVSFNEPTSATILDDLLYNVYSTTRGGGEVSDKNLPYNDRGDTLK